LNLFYKAIADNGTCPVQSKCHQVVNEMGLFRFEAGLVIGCTPFLDCLQDAFGTVFLTFLWVEDDV
jgi:hypothetical protein